MIRLIAAILLTTSCGSNALETQDEANVSPFQVIEYRYNDIRLNKEAIEISWDSTRSMSSIKIHIDSLATGKYKPILKIKNNFKDTLIYERVRNMGGNCVYFGQLPNEIPPNEIIEIDGTFKIQSPSTKLVKRSVFEYKKNDGTAHKLHILTHYRKNRR